MTQVSWPDKPFGFVILPEKVRKVEVVVSVAGDCEVIETFALNFGVSSVEFRTLFVTIFAVEEKLPLFSAQDREPKYWNVLIADPVQFWTAPETAAGW
jgi:hypothetical protein